MNKLHTPGVVFQPQTYRALQDGVNLVVDAIKPTLGPRPRWVALDRMERNRAPELLDKGALIAQRIIDLADSNAAMGAMLLRQMLWQQYKAVGDGTATAAVIFQCLFNDGVRHVTAGGSPMRLRRFLLEALEIVLDCLSQQATAVNGREQTRQIALMHSQDSEVADVLSEVYEVLGEFGRIDVRTGHGRGLEREYVHGVYWEGGVHGQEFIRDNVTKMTSLAHCLIFLSDLEIDDPRDLLPLIEVAASRSRALVVVASGLSANALGLLTHINSKSSDKLHVLPIRLPGERIARTHFLEELARISGARPYLQVTHADAKNVLPGDLGHANSVWASKDTFCIAEDVDGGTRRADYLAELHGRYQETADPELRSSLRERLGRLMGASATLLVGGAHRADIEQRKTQLKAQVSTLRACLEQGVVCGGGAAYLNCRKTLKQRLKSLKDPDARAAYVMMLNALTMPTYHLLHNAGLAAGELMARVERAPNGYGFDVVSGQIASMRQSGILDSALVTASALERAVKTAALGLTVDVLVHRKA